MFFLDGRVRPCGSVQWPGFIFPWIVLNVQCSVLRVWSSMFSIECSVFFILFLEELVVGLETTACQTRQVSSFGETSEQFGLFWASEQLLLFQKLLAQQASSFGSCLLVQIGQMSSFWRGKDCLIVQYRHAKLLDIEQNCSLGERDVDFGNQPPQNGPCRLACTPLETTLQPSCASGRMPFVFPEVDWSSSQAAIIRTSALQ